MIDFGRSDSPAVQSQLDRLSRLSLPQGRFGLHAIREMMLRLGNPHQKLPPIFHVAGTNGKGSTCAFLRAMLEADGKTVHATASPHLVRYNERIRIAGKLIEDDYLAAILKEVLDATEDIGPSFFEVTIAASFLAFVRTAADACIIEVGLGGRFDATNVVENPVVCGIASLGIDHERFLLAPEEGTPAAPLARIAFEKAGIAKPGATLVTQAYPPEAEMEIEKAASQQRMPLVMREKNWAVRTSDMLHYTDQSGTLDLPLPTLPGPHQAHNAGLATAMLRHQTRITCASSAIAEGIRTAHLPARLQCLASGPLTGMREVWLDGGHNPDAGGVIARHFAGQKLHLIIGMIHGKDPRALLGPLGNHTASITTVPISTHNHYPAEIFGPDAAEAASLHTALAAIPDDGLPILIAGSLYLAGDVLRQNNELPQ